MAQDKNPEKTPGGPSVKDGELYESLRKDDASKEKAARIANAAANSSREDVGEKAVRRAVTRTGPSTNYRNGPRNSTLRAARR